MNFSQLSVRFNAEALGLYTYIGLRVHSTGRVQLLLQPGTTNALAQQASKQMVCVSPVWMHVCL